MKSEKQNQGPLLNFVTTLFCPAVHFLKQNKKPNADLQGPLGPEWVRRKTFTAMVNTECQLDT